MDEKELEIPTYQFKLENCDIQDALLMIEAIFTASYDEEGMELLGFSYNVEEQSLIIHAKLADPDAFKPMTHMEA